ncbi:Uncharacterised protein [Sebaldella termitidis]|uniref:Uncharacterized protein n=1 Tax=Sebaldella termitidis (strain ATCC 33386 / NCTC 11300) TaxID=526218 RepID=D1AJ93_SEBTE|nr:hypothetical protein [Sebaldella termitidis]ACZ08781.1 hypothetical protein Sterm_1924 [Sebaldella termitidis ATCC 33386]SUI24098.1 Uncharacterised protein [Sebaldella termitidis]
MNKKEKIWLGFLAFAPFAAAVIINGMIAKNLTSIMAMIFEDAFFSDILALILKDYSFIFILWGISCILSLTQKVVYIILALKNKNIKRTIKFLYIVCMVFFEIAVMIYFYLEILHGKKEKKEEDEEENTVWID